MRIVLVLCLFGIIVARMHPVTAQTRPEPSRDVSATRVDSVGNNTKDEEHSRREIKEEMARIGAREGPGERQWERQKSPTVAMISSMVMPGLGQLYNGRRIKTMVAVGAFSFYLGSAWLENKKSQEFLVLRDSLPEGSIPWRNADILYNFHKENAVTYLWWTGAVWLICVLDAFVDAHLHDVRSVTPTVERGSDNTQYIGLSIDF